MKPSTIQTQQQAPNQYDHIRKQMETKGPEAFGEMMEGIFLQQMLEQMNKSLLGEGMFGDSNQGKIFQGMFTQRIADQIAETGGIGLADMISRNMQLAGSAGTGNTSPASSVDLRTIEDRFFPLERSTEDVLKQRTFTMKKDGDE